MGGDGGVNDEVFGQGTYRVRFDWGPIGAAAIVGDVAVVVDVLSFSTSVTVAVERGMTVFPYPWRDARAHEFAAERDAVVAVGRLEAASDEAVGAQSLSPARLLTGPFAPRLVLPSPNGSTIAAALQHGGAEVLAGCLRNARTVAQHLSLAVLGGLVVSVVAAGERWGQDDSLRPALEDQIGAGAILSELVALGHGGLLSPEAWSAVHVHDGNRDLLRQALLGCVSGRELAERGFGADVEVAAQVDVSSVVPMLVDGAFVARGR